MNKLITKHNYGTNRGGLVPHQESGTWGDRGQGNELQSALENGLTGVWNGVKWVGDKIINAGDYIDRGLAYAVGLIPGGMTPEESVENMKRQQNPQTETFTASDGTVYTSSFYEDVDGNKHTLPITTKPPLLPSLPTNAPKTLVDIYGRMKKLVSSWRTNERYYASIGKPFETSKTVTRFNQLLKEYNEGIKALGKSAGKADDVELYGKAKEAYKSSKAMATDMRSVNGGRPVRIKYLRQIEESLAKDQSPWAVKAYENLKLKRAKIQDKQALKTAEEKIFRDYATRRNMEHQLKQLGWYE